MSNKYQTLARLRAELPVPPLAAIDDADLSAWWTNHARLRDSAEAVLRQIKVTAGAFLDDHLDRLPTAAEIEWAPQALSALRERLAGAGLDVDEALAVRSSAGVEDGSHNSFAGIFRSVLDVRGLDALCAAIEQVWSSAFSRAAVVERMRLGDAGCNVDMTIILQRMVRARWAGVAFSHDPLTGAAHQVVEAVPRLAEGLVSGAEVAATARVDGERVDGDEALVGERPLIIEVATLARRVAQELGRPADIEWVADDVRVWLVQARPVTSLATRAPAHGPVLTWTDLYLAPDDDLADYRPLPGFAQYFRSKRLALARFANENGVAAGRALLVRANRAGLERSGGAASLTALLASPRTVLDFSDEVRQQIVDTHDLCARLLELSGDACATFVVREFLGGDCGLITQRMPDGLTLCEFSVDGLLAINRGTASTRTAALDASGACAGYAPPVERPADLAEITRRAVDAFGPVQLEWVASGGRLSLIDFSPISGHLQHHEKDGLRTISPGFAEGRCVTVAADRSLQEVSVSARVSIDEIPAPDSLGPGIADLVARLRAHDGDAIVVCPRPYAALAAVLPFVRGFVFEQASVLCHLAILLRERGIPAIASTRLYEAACTDARVTISARA